MSQDKIVWTDDGAETFHKKILSAGVKKRQQAIYHDFFHSGVIWGLPRGLVNVSRSFDVIQSQWEGFPPELVKKFTEFIRTKCVPAIEEELEEKLEETIEKPIMEALTKNADVMCRGGGNE